MHTNTLQLPLAVAQDAGACALVGMCFHVGGVDQSLPLNVINTQMPPQSFGGLEKHQGHRSLPGKRSGRWPELVLGRV